MAEKINKLIIEVDRKEYEFDGSGTPAPDSVGSGQIVDDSVMMEDLNTSVKNKIQKTYVEDEESLHMDFDEE